MTESKNKRSILITILLWILAVLISGFYVIYENDPYDPLVGKQAFASGVDVEYEMIRSKVIGLDLTVAVDTEKDVIGSVKYRRVASTDDWAEIPMEYRAVQVGGHGSAKEEVMRLAASLPSLDKMAGKYAYLINLELNGESLVIDDGKGNPIVTRYRGSVPAWVLIPHIFFIMLSMLFGIRAAFEALRKNGNALWLMWSTIITLLLGGFIFGPLMQHYAFGVLWSGIPLGWDLTDNKVIIELALWLIAIYFNTGRRKGGVWSKRTIAIAGIGTFLIYMIPHSLLGSAYDYTLGQGVGTGVQ